MYYCIVSAPYATLFVCHLLPHSLPHYIALPDTNTSIVTLLNCDAQKSVTATVLVFSKKKKNIFATSGHLNYFSLNNIILVLK